MAIGEKKMKKEERREGIAVDVVDAEAASSNNRSSRIF
jgi:hypothetical protein